MCGKQLNFVTVCLLQYFIKEGITTCLLSCSFILGDVPQVINNIISNGNVPGIGRIRAIISGSSGMVLCSKYSRLGKQNRSDNCSSAIFGRISSIGISASERIYENSSSNQELVQQFLRSSFLL